MFLGEINAIAAIIIHAQSYFVDSLPLIYLHAAHKKKKKKKNFDHVVSSYSAKVRGKNAPYDRSRAQEMNHRRITDGNRDCYCESLSRKRNIDARI